MANLTAKQESFIKMMLRSDEHARKGFELLISRPSPELLFEALEEQGLFSVDHHQGPVPAEEPGYFRIPYWAALDYLKAVAAIARQNSDDQLAAKVLRLVRSISHDSKEREIDNHHTWRAFASILGTLTPFLSLDDLEYLPFWQKSKFDRGSLVHEIDKGLLNNLLSEHAAENCDKICRILDDCTAIKLKEGERKRKSATVSEGYFLEQMLNRHAKSLGEFCGEGVAPILKKRIIEYFANESSSPLIRPAVEQHSQNHRWKHSANALVESLRDVLLAWVDVDPIAAHSFIISMIDSDCDMIRRIGLYLVDQRWGQLGDIYSQTLKPEVFSPRHIHELYNLLINHFPVFSVELKEETLDVLRNLPLPEHSKDPEPSRKRTQRQWLSACINKGYAPADAWYQELEGDPEIGSLSSHPDFHIYMGSFSGPGPSPFSAAQLIDFAEKGLLIEKLNGFEPNGGWRGPNKEALTQALEMAVQEKPEVFIRIIPEFLTAQRPYQYGLINGFKKLWGATTEANPLEWKNIWQALMDFWKRLFSDESFWNGEPIDDEDMTLSSNWIPPLVAEFLQAGTWKDEHSYPAELLPLGLELIVILLDRADAVNEPEEEAMTQAINSPKGKAIEALLNHALRTCRVEDAKEGNHAEKWLEMVPIFDQELAKCQNGNYEFSTIVASYISNLEYLNQEWLKENLRGIFPEQFPGNFICALEGLTFAQATRANYKLLVDAGVIDSALHHGYKGEHARERLVQRICLAYLWGDEDLQSPRLQWFFENRLVDDLKTASDFFWSVSNQELEAEQKSQIINFFALCIGWIKSSEELPKTLLSSLSRLSCYLTEVTEKELELLQAVAPYVAIGHHATDFIEELDRLADQSPTEVSKVLGRTLESHSPLYDYDDHLKSLMIKLVKAGLNEDVVKYADQLRRTLPKLAEEVFSLATNHGP